MIAAILHHAGDGSAPPVRVPSTVALAWQLHVAVFLAVEGAESSALRERIPKNCVVVCPGATDTLSEIARTMPAILERRTTTLYISTEPGHVRRATVLARILYWRRGVRIVPWPSAAGTYRAPWYLLPRDVVRAIWWRAKDLA